MSIEIENPDEIVNPKHIGESSINRREAIKKEIHAIVHSRAIPVGAVRAILVGPIPTQSPHRTTHPYYNHMREAGDLRWVMDGYAEVFTGFMPDDGPKAGEPAIFAKKLKQRNGSVEA